MRTKSHPKMPPQWPGCPTANSYTCRDEHHPVPSPDVPPPYQWHPVCISTFARQDSCSHWGSFFNTFLIKSRELYPAFWPAEEDHPCLQRFIQLADFHANLPFHTPRNGDLWTPTSFSSRRIHIQKQRDSNTKFKGMHPSVGIDVHLGHKDIWGMHSLSRRIYSNEVAPKLRWTLSIYIYISDR